MDFLPIFAKLMQLERWDEASDMARKALKASPAPGPWPMLCSRAHAAAGRHKEALAFGQMAQEVENASSVNGPETMAAMWFSAGLAALLNKDHAAALQALSNAHAIDPTIPDLARHLALAAQLSRQYDKAVAMYGQLLDAQPEDSQARYNMYLCLVESGAEDAAREIVRLWPKNGRASSEYLLASARLREHDGAYADCLALLEAGIPADIPAEQGARLDCLRGRCLRAMGDISPAITAFQDALKKDASSSAAVNELWMTLQAEGEYREAEETLDRFAKTHPPDPILEVKRALHVPPILRSAEQADAIRGRIRDFLAVPKPYQILGRLLEVVDSPPFYLAFHDRDDKTLLQSLTAFLQKHTTRQGLDGVNGANGAGAADKGGNVDGPDSAGYRQSQVPLRPEHAMRVGFISRHFTNHTIMSYFYRLLYSLCPRFGQSYILEFPQEDNQFRRDLAGRATLVSLPVNLDAAKSVVRELDLDLLVYTDLGMDPLTWCLAFSRLAKVQCALYGHPVTTGLAHIDYFLSPAVMEPIGAKAHYSEQLQTFPGLLCGFIPPPLPQAVPTKKSRDRVYLCAQSLFKIHPDMDGVFHHILSQDPDAVIHCFASRRQYETDAFRERLQRSLPAMQHRVRMLPQCSEEDFFEHLLGADAVLDSPHFSGGSTSFKALGIGVPVVTFEGRFMRGRQTAGMYRHLDVQGLTADSLESFGELALHMAHSSDFRRDKGRELITQRDRLFSLDSVDYLEQFFKSLPGKTASR
ncbi:tetratricopeptide repeat protein [Desulfovibrio sp. OttesenSCG-928-G15]|nr:tetratricopeptide repeat protein [Desulfovibrio sp. OttesenSCG-928-G15]